MSIKALLLRVISILLISVSSLSAQSLEKDVFEHIETANIVASSAGEISDEEEGQINDYLVEKYGGIWRYEESGVYEISGNDLKFVMLNLFVKEDKLDVFIKNQKERLQMGKAKQPVKKSIMLVLDSKGRASELPVKYDVKNRGLKYGFSNCLLGRSLNGFDINKDGVDELIVLKGYESAFNNYGASYNHYKIYAFNDSLFFDAWLSNTDYQSLPNGVVGKPKITGLNNGNESYISVYYDPENQLIKSDNQGLVRTNSLFFFNYIKSKNEELDRQLIVVWSRLYRPERKSDKYIFDLDSENYSVYEGSVLSNQSFVKQMINKEDVKAFLNEYSLSFDDGLTMEGICNKEK